jgi:ATP-dependent DNA helicase RecG
MNDKELKELIKAKESENLEFKLKVDEDLGKTICAFANTEGGILLLGIDDRGRIVGCKREDEEKIINIASNCQPAIRLKISRIAVKNKLVLKVAIQKTKEIHSYKGVVYKRVGLYK